MTLQAIQAARNRLEAALQRGTIHLHCQGLSRDKWRVIGISPNVGRPTLLCGTPACKPLHEERWKSLALQALPLLQDRQGEDNYKARVLRHDIEYYLKLAEARGDTV